MALAGAAPTPSAPPMQAWSTPNPTQATTTTTVNAPSQQPPQAATARPPSTGPANAATSPTDQTVETVAEWVVAIQAIRSDTIDAVVAGCAAIEEAARTRTLPTDQKRSGDRRADRGMRAGLGHRSLDLSAAENKVKLVRPPHTAHAALLAAMARHATVSNVQVAACNTLVQIARYSGTFVIATWAANAALADK